MMDRERGPSAFEKVKKMDNDPAVQATVDSYLRPEINYCLTILTEASGQNQNTLCQVEKKEKHKRATHKRKKR